MPWHVETKKRSYDWEFKITHIAQNIAERCQEYFQYFIAIEILQNILSQHYNFNFLKYF